MAAIACGVPRTPRSVQPQLPDGAGPRGAHRGRGPAQNAARLPGGSHGVGVTADVMHTVLHTSKPAQHAAMAGAVAGSAPAAAVPAAADQQATAAILQPAKQALAIRGPPSAAGQARSSTSATATTRVLETIPRCTRGCNVRTEPRA
eukprot:CAMPEP_0179211036 /NCGR_PEP_ID=MMETSP0797-20121207/159_1 /TAXON_ID=47934 /ORGANISM="Dinophysis acuminata, Strain DAEP01" /LENGTH=146 /DNA_ID=CAMNT_0020916157 /DNA_START=16 /DNA_END=452 /DNA_ORIENTATION=-